MTRPSEQDTSAFSEPALSTWEKSTDSGTKAWENFFNADKFNEDAVRRLLLETGYPEDHLHFIRGDVMQTLPSQAPDQVALLRLDTDWYVSTRHELEHLYPRLVRDGVLIIDDYGHWEGCRQAVDEYFANSDIPPVMLHRIDYTGRIAIKR